MIEKIKLERVGDCNIYIDSGGRLLVERGETRVVDLNLLPSSASSFDSWEGDGVRARGTLSGDSGEVTVRVEDNRIVYDWLGVEEFYEEVTLFAGSHIAGPGWQTFQYADQDRFWDRDKAVEVAVGSARDNPMPGEDHQGLLDPGDIPCNWLSNVPVRACAFQVGPQEWIGLSLPGPLPAGKTAFRMKDGKFSLAIRHFRPSCEGGFYPTVCFDLGLASAEDALVSHAESTRQAGYWRERSGHPAWWSLPVWSCYDEVASKGSRGNQPADVAESALTQDNLREWIGQIKRLSDLREFIVLLEQGYFARYGEYLPLPSLGSVEEVRTFIDEMREEGVRFAVYLHPYKFDPAIPFYDEHPECFLKRIAPGLPAELMSVPTRPGMVCQYLDHTHPGAREYLKGVIRHLVSDEPGCLNADFLAVHNTQTPDPEKWEFADPKWGIGDLMAHNVGKLVYETAKECKPDVMVRRIVADSFMQPWVDRVYINEDWTDNCNNWWKMARIVTRTLPQTLVDVTGWFVGMSKAKEFWMVVPSFGVACSHNLNTMLHPRGHYYVAREIDRRRMGSSWKVYENAPMKADQERRVDYQANGPVSAWRRHSDGPLAGFYAALNISSQCYATYSEGEIRVSSTEDRIADVPLPPGCLAAGVEHIMRDGRAVSQDFETVARADGEWVRFHMPDCGGEVFYARVRMERMT